VTRRAEPGAYRNLIGLKVSDDMFAAIERMRGKKPVLDFLRGLISTAAQQDLADGGEDWERRARLAEQQLERVREILS
jgi:hypothetical protein